MATPSLFIFHLLLSVTAVYHALDGGDPCSFCLVSNGVTVPCDNVDVGESGEVNGVNYTRRTRDQIDENNASTICTSRITDMGSMFLDASSFNENIGSFTPAR